MSEINYKQHFKDFFKEHLLNDSIRFTELRKEGNWASKFSGKAKTVYEVSIEDGASRGTNFARNSAYASEFHQVFSEKMAELDEELNNSIAKVMLGLIEEHEELLNTEARLLNEDDRSLFAENMLKTLESLDAAGVIEETHTIDKEVESEVEGADDEIYIESFEISLNSKQAAALQEVIREALKAKSYLKTRAASLEVVDGDPDSKIIKFSDAQKASPRR